MIRGDGEILGAVVFGIIRAAVTTSVVIAMTVLLLRAADGISSDVIAAMPAHAFDTLAHSWASSSLPAAIATTMLGFVAAFAMVIAALVLLVEFVFRNAAIYVAVAFLPVTLALAIHPGLASAQQKLIRILGMFVMFKPVALATLAIGFQALAGGLSSTGSSASISALLAGVVIIAIAASSPWTLMHLISPHVGAMFQGGRRGGGRSSRADPAATGGTLNHGQVGGRTQAASTGSGGGFAAAAGGAVGGAVAALGVGAAAVRHVGDHGAARMHVAAGGGGSAPGGSPFPRRSGGSRRTSSSGSTGGWQPFEPFERPAEPGAEPGSEPPPRPSPTPRTPPPRPHTPTGAAASPPPPTTPLGGQS